jgi:hypothetical protein
LTARARPQFPKGRYLDSPACIELMSEYIAKHPDVWDEDIGEE